MDVTDIVTDRVSGYFERQTRSLSREEYLTVCERLTEHFTSLRDAMREELEHPNATDEELG